MRSLTLHLLLLALAAAGMSPAFGQFTPISTPTGAYTSSTTVLSIAPSNGTTLASLTNGTQTVSMSPSLIVATVPGGGWATWGAPPNTETATPRVMKSDFVVTTVTLTLSAPSNTFGVEVEPGNFGSYSITATFLNGATTLGSITRTVNGSSGALLMAATSTTPITSVVISAPLAAGGFALAQFRYASPASSVPAVSTTALCGLGMALLAGGAMLARRQNAAISATSARTR